MYQIYLTNFGYFKEAVYYSMDAAIAASRMIGFECTVHDLENNVIVGEYSPIGGYKRYF